MVIPEDLVGEVLMGLMDLIEDPETLVEIRVSSEDERHYLRTALGYLSAVIPEASMVEVTLGSVH